MNYFIQLHMSYCYSCNILLHCFILFNKIHQYNTQYSYIDSNNSKTITGSYNKIDCGQFVIYEVKKKWTDAILLCKNNNMRLGEVKTMNDAQSISKSMLKNRPDAIESAWIGGYINLTRDEVANWRWQSTNDMIIDDNELWTRELDIDILKNGKSVDLFKQYCLLLDLHLNNDSNDNKTKPNYIKATCDILRNIICEKFNRSVANISNLTSAVPSNFHTSRKFISSMTPSSITNISTAPLTTVSTVIKSSSNNIKKKQIKMTRKTMKFSMTTTDYPSIIEEYYNYPDYKMWEIGMSQMKIKNRKMINNNDKKLLNVTQQDFGHLARIKIQELKRNSTDTARKPIVKSNKIIKKLYKPLRLYYAFEGPMVGGLTATPLPNTQSNDETDGISARHYHKYINRRKYYEHMKKYNRNN